jgi:hypothetical protein
MFKDADWYLSTIPKLAHATSMSAMKLTIANAAEKRFVTNIANMFHATIGSMFAKTHAAQKKISKYSRLQVEVLPPAFFLPRKVKILD